MYIENRAFITMKESSPRAFIMMKESSPRGICTVLCSVVTLVERKRAEQRVDMRETPV